jgi:hypothetical protein
VGLCCVAPAFVASADFALDKPAGQRAADLRGARIGRSLFVVQAQLDAATGDASTTVPASLGRPGR